jgi:hypothetical protein
MFQDLKQAAVVSDARGARGGNDGGTSAPPSNTAPDNCTLLCQPLRWGIDSLYLSYPGELAPDKETELRELKALAQRNNHEAAKAQFAFDGHVFEVKDKSSGLFAFTLADGAFDIRLSASRSKKLPMAYVQVRSGLLAHKSAEWIENHLRCVLQCFGTVQAPKVSRIDLFTDFASTLDMESWQRQAWVTKASAVHQYAQDSTFSGWSIGAGAALMGRLYLKTLELQKSGKFYLLDLWRRAGWDGERPVWRLEFEFRREVLGQLRLDTLPEVLEHLNGLWSYATTEWLKLCEPNESDRTRSRWPIHPLWMLLSSIDWDTKGGPLSREFKPTNEPSEQWLGRRSLSLIASMASIMGTQDFGVAADRLLDLADRVLGDDFKWSGVPQEKLFAEMVQICNRKYNLRLNKREATPGASISPLQNPYYRGKHGMPDLDR